MVGVVREDDNGRNDPPPGRPDDACPSCDGWMCG